MPLLQWRPANTIKGISLLTQWSVESVPEILLFGTCYLCSLLPDEWWYIDPADRPMIYRWRVPQSLWHTSRKRCHLTQYWAGGFLRDKGTHSTGSCPRRPSTGLLSYGTKHMTRRECTKSMMPIWTTTRKVSVSTPLTFWLTMKMIYA